MTEDRLVNVKEAGRVLGVSHKTVRRMPEVMAVRVMVPMPGRRRREVPRWRLSDLYKLIETWAERTRSER